MQEPSREPQGLQRKLAAILSADVKGYSRLMGEDEVVTVRTAGDRIRITAPLIEAVTGWYLWAEGSDGAVGDVFALQEEVTRKIVAALAVKLTSKEKDLVANTATENVAAYDAFLQGREHYHLHTRNDMAKAVASLKKAIELDSKYGRAHAMLAVAYSASANRGWARILVGPILVPWPKNICDWLWRT